MLKHYLRPACLVALVLAGLAVLAQAAPAGKAAQAGEPVFMDFGALTQTVMAVGEPKTGAGTADNGPRTTDHGSLAGDQKTTGPQDGQGAASTNVAPPTVSPSGYVPDDKYKLRVGDKISFQILEDRDAPRSLVVTDSGELDAPYVGRVAAADKTCKQLSDELKARLEKEYYHRATVIIALDVANKLLGRVYVWGQVRQQGGIDLTVNENLTAGKAILRAGGFADFANKKKVKLIRSGAAEGAGKQTFELNMVDILERGQTEKDMVLQPEDFIIVPSRLINF